MTDRLPPIYFYISERDWPSRSIPESADRNWQGFSNGIYSWTLQTYLRLRTASFPCELVKTLPTTGIVLAHRDSLPDAFPPPGAQVLLVCLKAEREHHPYAQLHVVQNPQEMVSSPTDLWPSYYMPHWLQPGLIPRDPARGDRFETVAYFGLERNLAPALQEPSWSEQLSSLGLRWQIVNRDRWHDYSEVDVVLAVRSFDRQAHTSKPATKLYNAWHAGVPAVLGPESAFQAERHGELDYLEVTSLTDAIAVLKRLRDDVELRHAMIANGQIRATDTQSTKLVERWQDFLINQAVPVYERWCRTPSWTQQLFWQRRYVAFKMRRVRNRLRLLATRR
jgi:hypothetical protein